MTKVMTTFQELLEEAKKRTVLFVIVVLTAAYFMSLTSNSVWVNIPIAILVIATVRRVSYELEIRWGPANKRSSHRPNRYKLTTNVPLQPSSTKWKRKIDSPIVEAAIEEFTKHIVSEWVSNLWYSSITPDQEGPQEIRCLINEVIGEIAVRAKQVNLINLLTSDVVNLVANHLELYREARISIGSDYFGTLSSEERDDKIKQYLASSGKLHPAACSLELEHRVLQRVMGGVLTIVLRPEDAGCKVVRCLARELMACAVMRPIMNFANPWFINGIIEGLVISSRNRAAVSDTKSTSKLDVCTADSRRSVKGAVSKESNGYSVELIDVGRNVEENNAKAASAYISKKQGSDMIMRSEALPGAARSDDWAYALDNFRQKKTQALAPEHLDNLWAKGRSYRKKEAIKKGLSEVDSLTVLADTKMCEGMSEMQDIGSMHFDDDFYGKPHEKTKTVADGDDHSSSNKSATSRVVHHPLEIPETLPDENSQGQKHRRAKSIGGLEGSGKQEKLTSLSESNRKQIVVASGYKPKLSCKVIGAHYEKIGSKSFAVYSISVTDAEDKTWVVLRRFRNFEQLHRRLRDMPHYTPSLPPKRFLSSNLDNSFVRERCILLNKYLKDLLSIPSIAELHEVWDFLSSKSQNYGFGDSVSIMKTLAVNVDDAVDDVFRQIKGVSDGVLKTAGLKTLVAEGGSSNMWNPLILSEATSTSQPSDDDGEADFGTGWHSDSEVDNGHIYEEARQEVSLSEGHSPVESLAGSETNEDDMSQWSPPKLTVPLLNLFDIVFQLEARSWIRRQVLWMAKQVLQLGMGDAIDDWLLTKIQYLRKEDVIASAIRWIERILWPDGIFITKHPSTMTARNNNNNNSGTPAQRSFEERLEGARRAMVVRELIQDRAPTALVSLIGGKQYQRCAKDMYGFLQSDVCMKQVAFSLLEKLVVAAFPELEDLIVETRNIV